MEPIIIDPNKRYALVLSGGGCYGSFQIGILDYLINNFPIDFKGLYGISVGTLNTSVLATAGEGNAGLRDAFAQIKKIWVSIRGDGDIYKKRIPILPSEIGLLFKSMYIPRGLEKIVHDNLSSRKADIFKSKRKLAIGVVSMEGGDIEYLRNDPSNREWYDQFEDYVMASASMPVFFPPVKIVRKGSEFLCFDGGLRDISPLGQVIQDDDYDEIIVINCSTHDVEGKPRSSFKNGIDYLKRTLEILTAEIISNDVKIAELINELLGDKMTVEISSRKYKKQVIHVIVPQIVLPFNHALDFNPNAIRVSIEHGVTLAKSIFR